MNFDLTEKSKMKINIDNYVERIINEFPTKISKCDAALTPVGNNIFEKVKIKRLGKK